MADDLSAEAIHEQHLKVLGAELGEIYHALQNELTLLYAKWLEFKKLYATSPERVALLNRSGSFIFRVLQDILWDDILLHLARLTDPPKSNGKTNLTIKRLVLFVKNQELSAEIENLVSNLDRNCAFARDRRNRHLAHCDLDLVLGRSEIKPLPAASRRKVEEALSALASVLNRIEAYYFHSEVRLDLLFAPGDAEVLVSRLALADRAEISRQKRLQQGEPLPEDLESRPV